MEEIQTNSYVNPRNHEGVPTKDARELEKGARLRWHSGEIRAHVTYDHVGLDPMNPFVVVDKVFWKRGNVQVTDGQTLQVDLLKLFYMPGRTTE